MAYPHQRTIHTFVSAKSYPYQRGLTHISASYPQSVCVTQR